MDEHEIKEGLFIAGSLGDHIHISLSFPGMRWSSLDLSPPSPAFPRQSIHFWPWLFLNVCLLVGGHFSQDSTRDPDRSILPLFSRPSADHIISAGRS